MVPDFVYLPYQYPVHLHPVKTSIGPKVEWQEQVLFLDFSSDHF